MELKTSLSVGAREGRGKRKVLKNLRPVNKRHVKLPVIANELDWVRMGHSKHLSNK
jgi:hypothetical protein